MKLFRANPYKHRTLRHFSREGKRGAWESLCFHDGCSLTTWPSSKRADNREAALPTYSFILSKRCWTCTRTREMISVKLGKVKGPQGDTHVNAWSAHEERQQWPTPCLNHFLLGILTMAFSLCIPKGPWACCFQHQPNLRGPFIWEWLAIIKGNPSLN